MQSEIFDIIEALRQGGISSPLLFIMTIDEIIKVIDKEEYKVNTGLRQCK